MTARPIASTIAVVLAAASCFASAAETTQAQRCATVGDLLGDAFDRIQAILPACESDPRLDNTSCTTVVAMAGLVEQAGLMPMLVGCVATGHAVGANTDRLGDLMGDVGPRLTNLAAALGE